MATAVVLTISLVLALVLMPVFIRIQGGYGDKVETTVCAGGALLAGLVGVLYRKHGDRASLGLVVGRWRVMTLKRFVEKSDPVEEMSEDKAEGSAAEDGGSGDKSDRVYPDEPFWGRMRRLVSLGDRLRRPAHRFLKRLIASFRIRQLRADIHYGFESPDTTGRAVGYATAIRPFLGRRVILNLQPDFARQRLEGTADLKIALWPVRLVWAIACLSPHALTLWLSEKKRSRKKRKAA